MPTTFFDGDEGLHAYEALRVSAYLREGDLAGASTATLINWFYPPAHPWLLGTALILFPATRATVRLFSLVIYTLDVFLLYALGRWLARDTRWPWLAGLAAALPALAAPPVWIMGSLVYLELLGVLFILLAFWGYWQGSAGREWGWLGGSGHCGDLADQVSVLGFSDRLPGAGAGAGDTQSYRLARPYQAPDLADVAISGGDTGVGGSGR